MYARQILWRGISIPSFKRFYNVVWTIRLSVSVSMGSFVSFWKKTIGSLILLSLMFQASMRSAMRNTLYVFFKIHISYY